MGHSGSLVVGVRCRAREETGTSFHLAAPENLLARIFRRVCTRPWYGMPAGTKGNFPDALGGFQMTPRLAFQGHLKRQLLNTTLASPPGKARCIRE